MTTSPGWSRGRYPVGHQNAIAEQIKRLDWYDSTSYLKGVVQLRSDDGYPCLCGGRLLAYPFPATSQTRVEKPLLFASNSPSSSGSSPDPNWIASIGCSGSCSAGCG